MIHENQIYYIPDPFWMTFSFLANHPWCVGTNRVCNVQNWPSWPISIDSHSKKWPCQPETATSVKNGQIGLKSANGSDLWKCSDSYIRMAVSTKNDIVGWIWLFLQKWSSCSKPPLSASNRFNNPNQHYNTKTFENGHVNQNWHWCVECMFFCRFQQHLLADVVVKQDQMLCMILHRIGTVVLA